MSFIPYQEPSSQTVQAIDHCRKQFAETKGVTRGAVDQLFAGNTHDPYPPFRAHFRDVCLTAEAAPDAYLNDLMEIHRATRPVLRGNLTDAFLDQMKQAHKTIETFVRALADGDLDKQECVNLIPLLSKTRSSVDVLLHAVMDRKNEIEGVRAFARKEIEKRRATA